MPAHAVAAAYDALYGLGIKDAIRLVEAHLRVDRLTEEHVLLEKEMMQHMRYFLGQLTQLRNGRRALEQQLGGDTADNSAMAALEQVRVGGVGAGACGNGLHG